MSNEITFDFPDPDHNISRALVRLANAIQAQYQSPELTELMVNTYAQHIENGEEVAFINHDGRKIRLTRFTFGIEED